MIPINIGLKNDPLLPHTLISVQGSPVPWLKFQVEPIGEDTVNPANLFRSTT